MNNHRRKDETMEKEKYQELEMEVIQFDAEDVITTSEEFNV